MPTQPPHQPHKRAAADVISCHEPCHARWAGQRGFFTLAAPQATVADGYLLSPGLGRPARRRHPPGRPPAPPGPGPAHQGPQLGCGAGSPIATIAPVSVARCHHHPRPLVHPDPATGRERADLPTQTFSIFSREGGRIRTALRARTDLPIAARSTSRHAPWPPWRSRRPRSMIALVLFLHGGRDRVVSSSRSQGLARCCPRRTCGCLRTS
jgi:hypothetical protein